MLLCLFTACLWSTCSAQDVDKLNQYVLGGFSRRDFLQEHADYIDFEEISDAFEQTKFWTMEEGDETGYGDNSSFLTPECKEAVDRIRSQPQTAEIYTILELIDATGKVPAGLFQGNIYADGAYDECFSFVNTSYCLGFVNISISLPKSVHLPVPFLGWKFGMCVPKGCTGRDIAKVVNSTIILIANETQIACTSTKRPPYNAGAIIMITVCCLFAALVVISSTMHCMSMLFKDGLDPFINDPVSKSKALPNNESPPSNRKVELNLSDKTPLLENTVAIKEKTSRFDPLDFITAFSVFKTVPTILSTKQPPSAITCINGLRVLSMFWVILCHSQMWFMISTGADNMLMIGNVLSRFSFQAVGNAFFSVDSFFFLSGLLVAYLTLRQMARKNGRFPFIAYYVHRYLRLTPAYAFVLFFIWLVSMHITDGPYYTQDTGVGSNQYEYCEKYWWTNLLYINNVYPWKLGEECIGWSWYLANDMQFYIISPLIIIPLYFFFPLGLLLAGGFLMLSFIITGALTGVFDFQANTFAPFAYQYATNVTVSSQDLLYIKPWHRISPYLVGLILGYLLYRKFRFPFHRLINLIFYSIVWILAAVILMTTLYGLYPTWHGHTPSLAENVLYNMFSRFSWGVGLALLVFACHNGYGWVINSFLSMKFWIPLSRLSYNAYLVHPFVLTVFYGSLRKVIHYEDINMAFQVIANIVVSYGVAAIVAVFVEFPLGNIEQAIFKIVGLGGRESARHGDGKDAYVRMKYAHVNN